MSLCHRDVTILKTDNPVLINFLYKKSPTFCASKNVDVIIVDGFFILHLMKGVQEPFGDI